MPSLNVVRMLDELPLTHTLVRRLHLRPVANAVLGAAPIVRTLPSGVKYRVRHLESLTLADYMFEKRAYEASLPKDVRTFVDLGCNVGYFVAFLADRSGRRDLRGLAVDANRDLVRETEWALDVNGLDGVTPVFGLVGGEAGSMGEFLVHAGGLLSSRYSAKASGLSREEDFTRTRAPVVDVEAVWRGVMGDVACDLLKIDIEGGEADFIVESNPFLSRVKQVVVECHKWIISTEELDKRLRALGFEKRAVLEETVALEVSVHRRACA